MENFWDEVYNIKQSYDISMNLIINIAVKNAIEEWEEENAVININDKSLKNY